MKTQQDKYFSFMLSVLMVSSAIICIYASYIYAFPEMTIGRETYRSYQSNEEYLQKSCSCKSVECPSDDELTIQRKLEYEKTIEEERRRSYPLFASLAVIILSIIVIFKLKSASLKSIEISEWPWYKTIVIWLTVDLLSMIPSLLTGCLIMELLYNGGPEESWRPINGIITDIYAVPFIWLILLFTPVGWVNIHLLIKAIRSGNSNALFYSFTIFTLIGYIVPAAIDFLEALAGV